MTRAAEERRARGAARKRRAQMYLSQLSWLEGFAADGRWYVVGGEGAAQAKLDNLALARARRTVNKLRRNHGAALGTLVGDVDAWFARLDGVLRYLGEQIHGRAPGQLGDQVPQRVRKAALALAEGHPRLRVLVDAATSAWVLRPDVLSASIRWMNPRASNLASLIDGAGPGELRRVLELARLARENETGVDALIALLVIDVPNPQHTAVRVGNIVRWLCDDEKGTPSSPERSTPTVIAWVDRLFVCERAVQARALELLAAIDLAEALAPWRAWEAEHTVKIERAERIGCQAIDHRPKLEDAIRVIESVERARVAMPPAIALDRLLSDIVSLAEASRGPFHLAALRFMNALPSQHPPLSRVHLLRHAAEVAARAGTEYQAAYVWEALTLELEAGASDRMLGPWSEVFAGRRRPWVEEDLLEAGRRRVEVRRLAATLALFARDLPVSSDIARRLASALGGGLDVEQAVSLVRQLGPLGVHPNRHIVRAAIMLAGRDVAALAVTSRLMYTLCTEVESDEEALALLCERSAETGHAWLIRGLLESDRHRLIGLAELGRAVPKGAWEALESTATRPAWIGTYPREIAEALLRLASVDPNAQDTARRRLATDLPDRVALEREAATLRARGSLGEREARRLHNLEARISSPTMPSSARLKKLGAKLDTAALSIGGARLEAALTSMARRRVLAGLGLDTLPDWTLDRRQWSILLALIDLDAHQRALAGRLLRARAGPPPWDLRDEAVNRRFLTRLRSLGVNPSPWLDDAPSVVIAGDGRPLEVALCGDPLEVFAMGAYFGTCLSPAGGNFFSVVTNAADVNKRVLYARREGKVVGRCLLALTDAGRVLGFHPYAHDARIGFGTIARDFAARLAARMGSELATSGRVALLLGREWYDDGARDLVGRYQALQTDAFTAALAQVPPSGFVALLETTLQYPLDDVILPVVLGLHAVRCRAELIEPLAPHLLALRTLPDHTLLRAGDMAARNGDLELADRLLAIVAQRDGFESIEWSWGRVLAQRRPSFTLARLRQTRPRGVRGVDDERGDRLAVAALALETLRRPRQAAALYRRAITNDPWLASDLRPLLAALEANDG